MSINAIYTYNNINVADVLDLSLICSSIQTYLEGSGKSQMTTYLHKLLRTHEERIQSKKRKTHSAEFDLI